MEEPDQPSIASPTKSKHPQSNRGLIILGLSLTVAVCAFLTFIFMPEPVAYLQGSSAAGTDNISLSNDYNDVSIQLGLNDQALQTSDVVLNQANLLAVAKGQITIEETQNNLASLLGSRIATDKAAGKAVSSMQATLVSMQAVIRETLISSTTIETNLIAIHQQNNSAGNAVLMEYDNELKTTHGDCHIAHRDALNIINDLRSLK